LISIRNEALSQLNEKSQSFFLEGGKRNKKLGDWNHFNLYVKGKKVEENCQKVPISCKLLEPAIQFTSGEIKFSLMLPDLPVYPRCGPTNCKLRAYMSMKITGSTYLRVLNETRQLSEGKFVIYDDSFEHEIHHKGDGYHLGLIIDIWHPDLSKSKIIDLDYLNI